MDISIHMWENVTICVQIRDRMSEIELLRVLMEICGVISRVQKNGIGLDSVLRQSINDQLSHHQIITNLVELWVFTGLPEALQTPSSKNIVWEDQIHGAVWEIRYEDFNSYFSPHSSPHSKSLHYTQISPHSPIYTS